MTVQELKDRLEKLIAAGRGHMPVKVFDDMADDDVDAEVDMNNDAIVLVPAYK